MLRINRLREFVAEAVASIDGLNKGRVVVTKDELVKFMKDHPIEENMLLVGIVPEHDVTGQPDAWEVQNDLGFYILAKTDYSEHDHDGLLDMFGLAQEKALDLVKFILDPDEGSQTEICAYIRTTENITFPISPVKGLNGCNGYFVGVNFETAF